jgi:hypothetical protein
VLVVLVLSGLDRCCYVLVLGTCCRCCWSGTGGLLAVVGVLLSVVAAAGMSDVAALVLAVWLMVVVADVVLVLLVLVGIGR